MAVLQARAGLPPGQLFPIEGDGAVLGRHPDCDIVLESGAVSRQHARIVRVEGQYYIEDLQSRNGTLLNGAAVAERRPLKENDELTICDLVFVFHEGLPKVAAAEVADPSTTAMIMDDERPSGNSTIMSKLNVSSGPSGLQLQVNTEAKLKALLEISQTLSKSLNLTDVLPRLLEALFRIFIQADRGFIVLREPKSGRLVPKAVRYRRPQDAEMIRISRTIVNTVMNTKEAILSADAATDSRFDMAESIVDFHIRSMMCAPLVAGDGKVSGVIQIDTLDQRNRFNREDLDVLASVACQAAFAVENAQLHEASVREQALARELAVAHEVQRGLLPSHPPRLPGYSFFEFYEAASELGGDYYDYIAMPDGRVSVVVADVSGKGISASLLMARLSSETRYCLWSEPSPAAALGRLNQLFCESSWEDRFVTLAMCVLDPARHEVTVVNAGHLPPLLRHASKSVELLADSIAGYPLGVDPKTQYGQAAVPLVPGDWLTLYTDGVTEAMNAADQLYGLERLQRQLAVDAPRVDALGRSILDDVKGFVGQRKQSDDLCLAVFGRDEGEGEGRS